MRNISKIERLIKDFKKQNRNTIWEHLDSLGKNPHIFSDHLKGIGPHLSNNQLYFYAAYEYEGYRGLVVVCLDDYTSEEEVASEKPFNSQKPRYHTENCYRTSPVWQLSETIKLIKKEMEVGHNYWPVLGVLLTESTIINVEKMQDIWDEMNIIVIDKLTDLSHRKILVNRNEDLSYGTMLMRLIKELKEQPKAKTSDNINDEFAALMDKYLNDNSEYSEEENELASDCPTEESNVDLDNVNIPDGMIEQNLNLSVKVEILSPIANPREELNKLVGCQDIKRHLDELVTLTRYNKMIRGTFPDAKIHEVSLHSVFYGRPGTGKTTVCKIFGSLLHEAGVLSKGHVVVAERGTFIGTLWGDEERSVRQVLEIAKGGVLMIDEAYLLNGKHDNDPGKLVIQLLMQVLADESQRDIAVVLCGYKEPMKKMIASNPGLPSRFPNEFDFNDFTIDELLEITRRRIGEYQYHFTHQAWQKYRSMLTEAYQLRDPETWGNARFIANQLQRIFIQHAQRCVKESPSNGQRLLTLTQSDIIPIKVPRSKPRIGF